MCGGRVARIFILFFLFLDEIFYYILNILAAALRSHSRFEALLRAQILSKLRGVLGLNEQPSLKTEAGRGSLRLPRPPHPALESFAFRSRLFSRPRTLQVPTPGPVGISAASVAWPPPSPNPVIFLMDIQDFCNLAIQTSFPKFKNFNRKFKLKVLFVDTHLQ